MKFLQKKKKLLIYLGVAAVIALALAISWLLGYKYAAEHHDVVTITPTQAARAMREDHFYKDYGNKTLIINGTMTKMEGDFYAILVFKTEDRFKLRCETKEGRASLDLFTDKLKITAPGGSAVRQKDGVLLKDCEMI